MPPRERQKLQPRSADVLRNISDRYYREGNVEGMNRIQNQKMPSLQPVIYDYDVKGVNFPLQLNADQPLDNSGIMAMVDNRTSRMNKMLGSQYFGMGGYDFVEDFAPTLENLAYFQDIKDKDAMARDAGFYPYANPSWIENNPSYGLDYMADLWGGKGRVGFRKNLDDDEWNAYAGLKFNFPRITR